MIDLERLDADIAEISETVHSAIFNLSSGEKATFAERAGISRQLLNAVINGKSDLSLKRKIAVYRRIA